MVLAAPSLFEGFDLPILEALACCCRVIASDIGVHREILRKISNSNIEVRNGKLDNDVGSGKILTSHFKNPVSHFQRLTSNSEISTSEKVAEAMTLVKPDDIDNWVKVLYQYISPYEISKPFTSFQKQLASKFSWEEAA